MCSFVAVCKTNSMHLARKHGHRQSKSNFHLIFTETVSLSSEICTGDAEMAISKDPRYFLLDTIPTNDDKIITGCKLPTRKQVLLSFIAHKEDLREKDGTNSKKVLRDAANETAALVLIFYEKACIPILAPAKVSEEILKYYIVTFKLYSR